ncbi:MAG: hypothetical protein U0930_21705 [Pirellulales bacterium]
MNRDHNSELSWKWDGVVTLHLILSFVFLCLSLLSTSTDITYLSAYVWALAYVPLLAMALLIFLLFPTLARRNGKNLHLLFGLGTAVFLYLQSIWVWKRDFEYGYGISINPRIILGISVFCTLAIAVSWFLRRQQKTITVRQLAMTTFGVALGLAGTQHILRFDKMSSYRREIDAAEQLKLAGAQMTWKDWSVSSVAIRNAGVHDEQLERISEFKNLRSVSLEGNPITDKSLSFIPNVSNLHGIYLTDTQVGDEGLAYLADAMNLEELYLRGTNVTDAGLSNLKNLKAIGYLDLSNTTVSDAGLEKLKHLNRLYYLHLPGTRVTKAGMVSLGKSLPYCRIYGTPDGQPFEVDR